MAKQVPFPAPRETEPASPIDDDEPMVLSVDDDPWGHPTEDDLLNDNL